MNLQDLIKDMLSPTFNELVKLSILFFVFKITKGIKTISKEIKELRDLPEKMLERQQQFELDIQSAQAEMFESIKDFRHTFHAPQHKKFSRNLPG